MTRTTRNLVTQIFLLLFGCPVVFAQTQSEPAQTDASNQQPESSSQEFSSARIEEVLVTAQRRTENLQDVPIAITTLSQDSLALAGIDSVENLQVAVPGYMFTQGLGAYSLPRIRGIGSGSVGPGVENSVGVYVDGVYTATTASTLQFNNISQIAVLKGPQGTLFGRNSTGGVVQVTTKDPGQESELDVEFTLGNYGTTGTNIYAASPFSDTLAADIAVYYRNRDDGFGDNLNTGGDVGDGSDFGIRSKFKWLAGDRTEVRLTFDYTEMDYDQPIIRLAEGTSTIWGPGLDGPGFDVNTTFDSRMQNEQGGVSLRIDHEFDRFSFASITAYRENDLSVNIDGDTLPAPITDISVIQNDDQFTQEFQLLSPEGGPLTWVVGLFYLDAEGEFDPQTVLIGSPPTRILLNARQTTESLAGFAQGTWALSDSTNVIFGGRYTWEERQIANSNAVTLPNGFQLPPAIGKDDASFSEPTWRLAVDHRLSDSLMLYASYDRGFKSGLFDPSTIPPRLIDSEIIDSFEIGMKGDFLENQLRLNAAAFYYDYQNVQVVRVVDGVASLLNGAQAEITGIDMDATLLLTSKLSVTAGLSVLDNEFTEFPDALKTTPLPGGGNLVTSADASGNNLPMTPDWTANLTAVYVIPSTVGEFTLSGTYYHNDGYFEGPENRLRQDSFGLLNASLGWTSNSGTWRASLWGRNLTDEFYANQLSAQAQRDAIVPGDPLTFGITVGYGF